MPVFIDQCSWVCAHLAFFGGLKGCKLRMRITERLNSGNQHNRDLKMVRKGGTTTKTETDY